MSKTVTIHPNGQKENDCTEPSEKNEIKKIVHEIQQQPYERKECRKRKRQDENQMRAK